MDVTTNYNSANIAAVQQNRTLQPNGAATATERPVTPQAQPLDANGTSRVPLREENVTDAMLDRAFEDANRVLSGSSFRLSYATHEGSGRIMVTVLERQSDEVLREIPSESRLDIYARITEFVGLLFDRGN